MKLRDANLQVYEKNSFTYPLSSTAFIFSECIIITSSEEALKIVLLVIYLLNHDSSKSTFFMLKAFDVVLSKVFVK